MVESFDTLQVVPAWEVKLEHERFEKTLRSLVILHSTIQCLGGRDTRSVWSTHIAYMPPIKLIGSRLELPRVSQPSNSQVVVIAPYCTLFFWGVDTIEP